MKNLYTYEELENFAGGRFLTDELHKKFMREIEVISGKVYRGMPFPRHLLKTGLIIEEWYGSCHWSLDENVAYNFSDENINGYISEDYCHALLEEIEEEKLEFIKLILVCEGIKGIPLYKILKENGITQWDNEKEITTIGSNFKIIDIKQNKDVFYAEVVPC